MSEKSISFYTYAYLIVSTYFIMQMTSHLIIIALNILVGCIISDFMREHSRKSKMPASYNNQSKK